MTAFPSDSPYAMLDRVGSELPERLLHPGFRRWAEGLEVPQWRRTTEPDAERLAQLYYLRVGFLASAYVNQIGVPRAYSLPANIAGPLCRVAEDLERPPILSYAGYALYNWYRIDPEGPVALGNIDTIQDFVELYDEHWFILVHVEIEARAAAIVDAIMDLEAKNGWHDQTHVDQTVARVAATVEDQIQVLKRIPEHMSSELYYSEFRPYIRYFEDVVYEGVDRAPVSFRGETGAQSSVMPLLVTFFKIRHEPNELTRHLADMRRYMPASHRALLERVDAFPSIRRLASADVFNRAMEAIAEFRSVHFGWAQRYIAEKEDDPIGTGGTPYVRWLEQLREETLAHRIGA
jgi:indoleamine 2,3-dioxygenase